MRDVPIRGESIRLGQALKLSGLADSGGEARALLEQGAVTVNAEVETRRGRQLRHGDVVALGEEALRIEAPESGS
jgi:ribosome-associated protein